MTTDALRQLANRHAESVIESYERELGRELSEDEWEYATDQIVVGISAALQDVDRSATA